MNRSESTDRPSRYRLYGTVGSPYALKLRSLLRYKRMPFDWYPASLEWIPSSASRPARSQQASSAIANVKPAVLPVVYFPSDRSFRNDSTVVAWALDSERPDREIKPPHPGTAFLSSLLEDMADEWGVKIAFQYRWGNSADRIFKSRIVSGELLGGGFNEDIRDMAARHFAERQVSRMPLVGCTPENSDLIITTFYEVCTAFGELQRHSSFLFGERPTLADFGWYGQLCSLADDPTPRSYMQRSAPDVFTYLQLLEDASGVDAEWDQSPEVTEAARRLLDLAANVYLPFLAANEKALADRSERFTFEALGHKYSQQTFKYQVKCLQWLREEYAGLPEDSRQYVKDALGNHDSIKAL